MSGIAQIIQAMMSVSPQITRMGGRSAAGYSGQSMPAGDLSMRRYGAQAGGQQQAPVDIPEMPEISPMAQQTAQRQQQLAGQQMSGPESPPGMPGSQQEGPPDPNLMMQQGTPGIQALERQYQEAEEMVRRYSDPNMGIRDSWAAREKLPEARQRLAQAESNINAYNAEQEQIAAAGRGRDVYDLVLPILQRQQGDPKVAHEKATAIADRAMADPKVAEQIMEAVMSREATLNDREYEQSEEVKGEVERRDAYGAFGLPQDISEYLSKDEGLTVEQGVKLWRDDQAKVLENMEAFRLSQAKMRDEIIKADQAINTTNKALSDVGPFTAGLGSVFKFLPGTPAANLNYALDTLKAVTAFKELFDMRQASPTGGALGNVSNREIELLYSSWTALQQEQTPDRLRENLNELLERYQRVKFLLEAESSGDLKGISAIEQTKMADQFLQQGHMESFKQTVPNADSWMQALEAGDISTAEFEKEFGFTPIMDTFR